MASDRLGVKLKNNPDPLVPETENSNPDVSLEAPLKAGGLAVDRLYSSPGVDPYEGVEWENRAATIAGDGGEVVFEQKDVEIPASWSQLATNVVVSKYFRGPLGTPQRENIVKNMIKRVVDTIAGWGRSE